MILEMKVPSPGESISEVEIAEWLVSDGDYVEKDQTIAEVDSDKATLDLPAEESGIITLKANEGDTVNVGAVVCHIDTKGKKEKNHQLNPEMDLQDANKESAKGDPAEIPQGEEVERRPPKDSEPTSAPVHFRFT